MDGLERLATLLAVVEAGVSDGRLDGDRSEIGRRYVPQASAESADRGSNRVDKNNRMLRH
jgi:hypothetical protein